MAERERWEEIRDEFVRASLNECCDGLRRLGVIERACKRIADLEQQLAKARAENERITRALNETLRRWGQWP